MNRIHALILLATFAAVPAAAQHTGHGNASGTTAAASAPLSEGEVRKVDREGKKLTIKHGPLANLDMPPMTMVFGVKDPAALDKLKPGDKIRFRAEMDGTNYVVTRNREMKPPRSYLAVAWLLCCGSTAWSAQPLSMNEAIALATQRSAKLSAQSAAVQAADEMAARATELADPKLRFGIDNMPVSGEDAWSLTRDFMTMKRIGVMQEFANGDKRRARGERAAAEVDVEQAMLRLERTNVQRETAMAWYEVLHATRALEVMSDLVNAVQLQQETVGAAIAGGRSSTAEGYMARSALEAARDEVLEQERVLKKARIQLAQYIGADAQRPVGAAPDTSQLPRSVETTLASLESHPTLSVYEARESAARSEIALAQSMKKPDWGVEVSYGQRSPNFSNMLTVMLSVDLPVLSGNRQDRDIAAQHAQLERVRAQREDARRSYETAVRGAQVDWETWNRRVQRYETVLIPLAQERVKASTAAYRGGRSDLAAVIEARKGEAETRLALHNALSSVAALGRV